MIQQILFHQRLSMELVLLTDIHSQNILRLFDILPHFPFTASETMRDYYL